VDRAHQRLRAPQPWISWPLRTAGDALTIDATWAAMTVAFEFGLGRLVAKQSWAALLDDYNRARGRT
jgi:hypothetical protein